MGSRLRTRMGWMAVWAGTCLVATAAEPIAPDRFDQLRQKIKPQAGESRFWEIPLAAEPRRGIGQGSPGGQADIRLVWSRRTAAHRVLSCGFWRP